MAWKLSLKLPRWNAGVLGVRYGRTYRDFHRAGYGKWQMFVCRYSRLGEVEYRAWYVWDSGRWNIQREEGILGAWRVGEDGTLVHRPPLRSRPSDVLRRCFELRKNFTPGTMLRFEDSTWEVISYPCPVMNFATAEAVSILIRRPGDPTTLREVRVEEYR